MAILLLASLLGGSWWLGVVALVVLASLADIWRAASLTSRRSVQALTWHADGRWSIVANGSLNEAVLSSAPFVTPWLIVIRFKTGKDWQRSFPAVICVDSASDRDAIRTLRIRLLKAFPAL